MIASVSESSWKHPGATSLCLNHSGAAVSEREAFAREVDQSLDTYELFKVSLISTDPTF